MSGIQVWLPPLCFSWSRRPSRFPCPGTWPGSWTGNIGRGASSAGARGALTAVPRTGSSTRRRCSIFNVVLFIFGYVVLSPPALDAP